MNKEMEIRIRSITMSDREMVVAFFDQMSAESRSLFDLHGSNRKRILQCFEVPNPTCHDFAAVIPTENGVERMVGYVFLTKWDTMTPLLGIVVAEDYKGHGLGHKLMSFAEEHCIKYGKGGIFLTTQMANIRGQRLYISCGYQKLGMSMSGELLFFRYFPEINPESGV